MSGSKTITKVKVGAKPTGGSYGDVDVVNMSPIPPGAPMMSADNLAASGSVDVICITVFWDDESTQCCCEFNPAQGNGVHRVVAQFSDPDTLTMSVYPLPVGSGGSACACSGTVYAEDDESGGQTPQS